MQHSREADQAWLIDEVIAPGCSPSSPLDRIIFAQKNKNSRLTCGRDLLFLPPDNAKRLRGFCEPSEIFELEPHLESKV